MGYCVGDDFFGLGDRADVEIFRYLKFNIPNVNDLVRNYGERKLARVGWDKEYFVELDQRLIRESSW